MKILVLGSNGQLGRCLKDHLVDSEHEVIYTSREQIDVASFHLTRKKIVDIHPDLVINATAYTAVDKAEDDQEMANLINHLAVKNIAKICSELNCWLIHISTDYVFDGNSKIPYKEDDKTNPQTVYGETKLWGELAIKSFEFKYIIIRTAWVFSEYGNNFLKTMLHLGVKNEKLRVVSDQIGNPTYAQDIAKAIVMIIGKLKSKNNIIGTYHFAGDVYCSWADFAKDIFKEAVNIGIVKNKPKINKIRTSEFPALAKRPMQSLLDCSKFKTVFKIDKSKYAFGISSSLMAYKKINY